MGLRDAGSRILKMVGCRPQKHVGKPRGFRTYDDTIHTEELVRRSCYDVAPTLPGDVCV